MPDSRKDILLGMIRNGEAMTIRQQFQLAVMLSLPAILALRFDRPDFHQHLDPGRIHGWRLFRILGPGSPPLRCQGFQGGKERSPAGTYLSPDPQPFPVPDRHFDQRSASPMARWRSRNNIGRI